MHRYKHNFSFNFKRSRNTRKEAFHLDLPFQVSPQRQIKKRLMGYILCIISLEVLFPHLVGARPAAQRMVSVVTGIQGKGCSQTPWAADHPGGYMAAAISGEHDSTAPSCGQNQVAWQNLSDLVTYISFHWTLSCKSLQEISQKMQLNCPAGAFNGILEARLHQLAKATSPGAVTQIEEDSSTGLIQIRTLGLHNPAAKSIKWMVLYSCQHLYQMQEEPRPLSWTRHLKSG